MGFLMSISKLVFALAAASLVSTTAYAGHSGSPLKNTIKHQAVEPMKLKTEAFVNGNGESTPLPQFAFTPIDAGTVLKCTKLCTISADVTAQIQTAGADWAICITVDGADIECQYQGVQAGPSTYVVGNAGASLASVAIGSHTVQTQLYTESASATYQYYNMHYAVHQ
jgi:hypothetical protein